jgi:hypothetical protein
MDDKSSKCASDALNESALVECANNYHSFRTFLKVNDPQKGLTPLVLYDFQKKFIEDLEHKFVIAKKFRQGGFTTLALSYLLWQSLLKLQSCMVMCKTDRQATDCNAIVQGMLNGLPGWLQDTERCNKHQIIFKSGGKMSFATTEPACGRRVDYFLMDEPAFWKRAEQTWKAIYPTLYDAEGVYVVSTPNRAEGWFYDTWKNAKAGTNSFHPVEYSYTEHPQYAEEAWIKEMKKNLGEKGWKQEILAEFIDEEKSSITLDKNGPHDFVDLSDVPVIKSKKPVQPLVDKTDCYYELPEIINLNDTDKPRDDKIPENWSVGPNRANCGLMFDDDNSPPIELAFEGLADEQCSMPKLNRKRRPVNYIAVPHDLMVLSGLDDNFVEDEDSKLKPTPPCIEQVTHPEFAPDVPLQTAEDHAEFWGGSGNEHTDYWNKITQKRKREQLRLENNISRYCDEPELLCTAGIITKEEAEEMSKIPRPDLDILDTLMDDEELPEMELMFFEERLCINEVPTIIKEDDLRDLYNGYAAFNGPKEARKVVISTIKKFLMQLFRKE